MNRRMKFLNGHIYHIYNRGHRKSTVFHDRQDYLHFLRQLRDFSPVLASFANDPQLYREFVLDPLADGWEPRLMKKIHAMEAKRRNESVK